jgi:hypothetical protein
VKLHHLSVTPAVIRLGAHQPVVQPGIHPATAQKLVVDYAIDYVKSAGHSAAKVFKLKAFTLGPGEHQRISANNISVN